MEYIDLVVALLAFAIISIKICTSFKPAEIDKTKGENNGKIKVTTKEQ